MSEIHGNEIRDDQYRRTLKLYPWLINIFFCPYSLALLYFPFLICFTREWEFVFVPSLSFLDQLLISIYVHEIACTNIKQRKIIIVVIEDNYCGHCIMLQVEWSFYTCIEGMEKHCLLSPLLCLICIFLFPM